MISDSFDRLSALVTEPLLLVDSDGKILSANAAASMLLGKDAPSVVGRRLQDLLGGDAPDVEAFVSRCLANGTCTSQSFSSPTPAGGTIEYRLNGARLDAARGRRRGPIAVSFTRDDRDPLELAPWMVDLRDFFENAAVGVHAVGPDGIILAANRAELDLLGYEASEYVGHHIGEFHVDFDYVQQVLARLAVGEAIVNEEARMRRKDGSIRTMLLSSNAYFENGKFVHTRCFTRDITERKSNERANAELASIVSSSDDAIISKTLEGRITSWNAGAEQLFGYTAEEAIGKPVSMLAPPDRRDEMPQILAEIRAGRRVDHFDTVRLRKDGQPVSISLTVSPIRDSHGRIVGASKIARDVTARKRVEAERDALLQSERNARGDAERANRLKDEFLATLSHELRTPLSAILGWSHLLHREELSPEDRKKGLEVIERNARAQTQIIEDLLDLSRIVSGKLRLDVQRVNLAHVVEASLETVRPAAIAKEIQLQSVVDPFVSPVLGDSSRLQQVVWNLLSNAVKFTPKGGRVQVSLERVNSHVEIIVSDTGRGIEPEFLPYVFDRFRQSDASTTRRHGGLGIGLAVVKNLVELHGGTVHVKSTGEGKGATFIVKLPVAIVHEAPEERVHPKVGARHGADWSPPSLEGIRVLVVDDDPDARDLVRRVLEENRAHVVTAESAEKAFALFRRERPNVLVSDIGMPDEDGYDLIQRIRKFESSEGQAAVRKVPALALTAFARSEDRTRALVAGYEMHVAKPVEPQELVASVAALARRSD